MPLAAPDVCGDNLPDAFFACKGLFFLQNLRRRRYYEYSYRFCLCIFGLGFRIGGHGTGNGVGGGLGSANSSGAQNVDPYELFVYSFLANSDYGSEVHFFWYNTKHFYIATKDIGNFPEKGFSVSTCEQLEEDCFGTLKSTGELQGLKEKFNEDFGYKDVLDKILNMGAQSDKLLRELFLTLENEFRLTSPIYKALVSANIVTHIFRLGDTVTNPGNICFLTNTAGRAPMSKIIDFDFSDPPADIDDIFENFETIFKEFVDGSRYKEQLSNVFIYYFLFARDVKERIYTARTLISQSFFTAIDRAERKITSIVEKLYPSTYNQETRTHEESSERKNFRKQVANVRKNATLFLVALDEACKQFLDNAQLRALPPIDQRPVLSPDEATKITETVREILREAAILGAVQKTLAAFPAPRAPAGSQMQGRKRRGQSKRGVPPSRVLHQQDNPSIEGD